MCTSKILQYFVQVKLGATDGGDNALTHVDLQTKSCPKVMHDHHEHVNICLNWAGEYHRVVRVKRQSESSSPIPERCKQLFISRPLEDMLQCVNCNDKEVS
jgi:hypothetical protein